MIYVYVSTSDSFACVYLVSVSVSACPAGGQKRAPDSLEMELQLVESYRLELQVVSHLMCLMCLLSTELQSF